MVNIEKLKITDYTSYDAETDNKERWIQITSSTGKRFEGWLKKLGDFNA